MYNIPVQAYINFELNSSFSLCQVYDATVEIVVRNMTGLCVGVAIGFSFIDLNFPDDYHCILVKESLFKEVGIAAIATATTIETLYLDGNLFVGGCDKTAFQSTTTYRIPSNYSNRDS